MAHKVVLVTDPGIDGAFAIALRTTSSIAFGSCGFLADALGGSSSRCAHATARRESPEKGASPVKHSLWRQPSA